MSPVASDDNRQRRRLATEIKDSLRELSNQLSLLNHQVGAQLELKDVDLDCLELITRHGPLSPSEIARRAGLHPATMTGVLDRLQRGGWIARERDPEATDRRAVTVRALRERSAEVFKLYSGMNTKMDELLADYTAADLELLAGFLQATTGAGKTATTTLAEA
ncbi:MarR family transcriptional regulator [Streptomyces sp. SID13031]|uniref:MarR family transcriptional regulator n=1 Tax=Streptomyces sp. SID13031 TaxID=2706046 RepID=UPI0013C889C7|nr:MarR family transcriptional regulator [Streptomyces sp. SID13031]NEA30479.1 MarR family transcriptional regulator [Streptomyces sp. SID13031]